MRNITCWIMVTKRIVYPHPPPVDPKGVPSVLKLQHEGGGDYGIWVGVLRGEYPTSIPLTEKESQRDRARSGLRTRSS